MNIKDRTVNPVGRPPGQAKSGGQKKGGIKVQTAAVKEAVLRVFHDLNAGDAYLRGIAESDPKLFLSLVARLIPVASEVTLDQRVTVNIGSAMQDAQARLEGLGEAVSPVIDHAPLVLAGEADSAQ
jgi:hypothetical protein